MEDKKCLNCENLTKSKNNKYCCNECFIKHKRKINHPNLKYDENDVSLRTMEIIIGSVLGDAVLGRIRKNENSKLNEAHSMKQVGWLLWKQENLKPIPFTYTENTLVGRKQLSNGKIVNDFDKEYYQCRINGILHPIFTKLELEWYLRDENKKYILDEKGKRIKCLPKNGVKLTDLILAVWFMDDGFVNRKVCTFSSESFTYKENCYLSNQINTTFGIKSYVVRKKKNTEQFQIKIRTESFLKFIEIIKNAIPDLPECMKYKIDTSNYTVPWHESSEYHPRSLFNDEIVGKIFVDFKNGMSQTKIAKKYNIDYRKIHRLVKGKTLYKFDKEILYKSKLDQKQWKGSYTKK